MADNKIFLQEKARLSDAQPKLQLPSQQPMAQQSTVPDISPELENYLKANGMNIPGVKQDNVVTPYQPKASTIKDILFEKQLNGIQTNIDPFKAGKSIMGDFRNPDYGNQFYDRYREHSKYEVLGFSPFRDNESLYNQNSTWWNEMSRAAGEWATLAGLGFMDALSFGSSSDTETAKTYEKAMAIGQSSKGGFGGFFTNLFLNSGYTVGIMGELAVEEILMALAEAGLTAAGVFSAGTATPGTIPLQAAIAGRMGYRFVSSMNKLKSAWKVGRNVGKFFTDINDVNKLRKVFTSTAQFLNPLENTVDFLKNADRFKDMSAVRKGIDGATDLAKIKDVNAFGKTYRTLGALYADVKNIRLAWGEGGLEGGMVTNQLEKQYLEEFRAKHGRMPNAEEQAYMKEMALKAGKTTGLINAPVIFLTNKLTFNGLVRGKFRGVVNPLVKGAKGTYFKTAKGFVAMPEKLLPKAATYIKNPKLLLSMGLKYSQANLAEGLQESMQEIIAGTTLDYYSDKFTEGNAERGGWYNYLANNLGKQFSPEGAEIFLSGFLMGGMIAPISSVVAHVTQGKKPGAFKTISDLAKETAAKRQGPEAHKAYLSKKQANEQALKEARELELADLNSFLADPHKYFSPELENLEIQNDLLKARDEANKRGDKKAFYDFTNESASRQIMTALRTGYYDMFLDKFKDMQNLSEEEIQEAYKMSKSDFDKIMNASIERAENIKSVWEKASTSLPNPFDYTQYPQGDMRNHMAIQHLMWNKAIDHLVLQQATFKDQIERQNSILDNLLTRTGLEKTAYSDISILTNIKTITGEETQLKSEIDALEASETLTPESKAILKDRKKRYELLQVYGKNLEAYKTGTDKDAAYKPLLKSYKDYIEYVAKDNGDYVKNDGIVQSLQDIIDYNELVDDTTVTNDHINVLLSGGFQDLFQRLNRLAELQYANKKAEIKNSLEKFKANKDKNQLLNALYDIGVFINPKELADLDKKGKVPDEFYFVNKDGEWAEEVSMTSDKYKEILAVLNKHIDKELIGKQTEYGRKVVDPYRSKFRAKDENDKRTFKQLMEQFDPNNLGKVPLKDVLKAIILSEYSNDREKMLAQNFLRIATDNEFVTFSDIEKQPFKHDAKDQSVIDARYAAYDYQEGADNNPLEHIILRGEILRRSLDSLEQNKQFKEDIGGLMIEATAALKSLDPNSIEAKMVVEEAKEALKSPQSFIIMSMTNEAFQIFLNNVEAKVKVQPNKEKTAWQKFIDLIIGAISTMVKSDNGTLLNAVLTLTTSQFAGEYVTPESVKETPLTKKPITKDTTIQELKDFHADIIPELIDLFKQANQNLIDNGEAPLLKNLENMSELEILNTFKFKQFLQSPHYTKKNKLIEKYNETLGQVKSQHSTKKTVQPDSATDVEVTTDELDDFTKNKTITPRRVNIIAYKVKINKPLSTVEEEMYEQIKDKVTTINNFVPTGENTEFIPRAKKQKLLKLGFDVRGLKSHRADELLNIGLTKDELNKINTEAKQEKQKSAKTFEDMITQHLQDVETLDDLNKAQEAIEEDLQNNAGDYANIDNLNELLEKKLAERRDIIIKDTTFVNVQIGETISMNDANESRAIVIDKTDEFILVDYIGQNEKKNIAIMKDEFNDKVLMTVYKAMNEPVAETQQIEESSIETAKKTDATVKNLKSEEIDSWLEESEKIDLKSIKKKLEDQMC